jgi:hypothetical protein
MSDLQFAIKQPQPPAQYTWQHVISDFRCAVPFEFRQVRFDPGRFLLLTLLYGLRAGSAAGPGAMWGWVVTSSTSTSVSPCRSPGEACCDGPDTRALGWNSYEVYSLTGPLRKEICISGFRNQARCGSSSRPGTTCCPPDAGQATAPSTRPRMQVWRRHQRQLIFARREWEPAVCGRVQVQPEASQ